MQRRLAQGGLQQGLGAVLGHGRNRGRVSEGRGQRQVGPAVEVQGQVRVVGQGGGRVQRLLEGRGQDCGRALEHGLGVLVRGGLGAVQGRGGGGREGLQADNLLVGVDDLGGLALDEAEQLHVALAELVGQVAELPLGGGVGHGARRQLAVVLEVVVDLVEAVHVQLANEGRDVGVLEILRQHVGELLARVEAEGVVAGRPPDEVRQQLVLQHVVELVDEHGLGLCGAGAGAGRGRRVVRELRHQQWAVGRVCGGRPWGRGGGGIAGVGRRRGLEEIVGRQGRAGRGDGRLGAVGAAADGHGVLGPLRWSGAVRRNEKQVRAPRKMGRTSCRGRREPSAALAKQEGQNNRAGEARKATVGRRRMLGRRPWWPHGFGAAQGRPRCVAPGLGGGCLGGGGCGLLCLRLRRSGLLYRPAVLLLQGAGAGAAPPAFGVGAGPLLRQMAGVPARRA